MNQPMISVIITTYKRSRKTLKRALNSVLNQTYKNIEIIIVDDNGNDSKYQVEVDEAIKTLNVKDKVKLIKHEQNFGAQKARNTGLKIAKGEYISLLDDDDEWLENKLELQLEKFVKSSNSNLGLVYCWFYIIKTMEDNSIRKYLVSPSVNTKDVRNQLLFTNFIGSNSFPLIKKDCFEKVGGFDEALEAKQDYDMWIRISKDYDIDFVDSPLCNYYDHAEERITKNIENKIRAENTFFNKHRVDIEKNRKAHASKLMTMGVLYFKLSNFKKAKSYLCKSIKLNPLNYKTYILAMFSSLKYYPKIIERRL